jgi:hypothetical protein
MHMCRAYVGNVQRYATGVNKKAARDGHFCRVNSAYTQNQGLRTDRELPGGTVMETVR